MFCPGFHGYKYKLLLTDEGAARMDGIGNATKCLTVGCSFRSMARVTMRITRGDWWNPEMFPCEIYQIRSRMQGSESNVNTEEDRSVYSTGRRLLTSSKPCKRPDDSFVNYQTLASYELHQGHESPDTEIEGQQGVIVVEQIHMAKRGSYGQGGRNQR